MTDPFEALREPLSPVDPDPDFAAELRDRLRRAILQNFPPEEETMTTTETRAELRSLTPYLAVRDARLALDFYVEVFGAARRADPIVMPDGRIGHAELGIGDTVLMLAEEHAEYHHLAPEPDGPHPAYRVEVADVDASVDAAVRAGARQLTPVEDRGHGRGASILDPFGYRWMVSAAPARDEASGQAGPRHGEAGYFTFAVPDDEAAKAFYGAVLGWQFSPGHVARGWGLHGTGLPMAGMWGGQDQPGWILMYAVDDLPAAVARVRAHGGHAGEPEQQPYGRTADCVDNQGIKFWLWQAS